MNDALLEHVFPEPGLQVLGKLANKNSGKQTLRLVLKAPTHSYLVLTSHKSPTANSLSFRSLRRDASWRALTQANCVEVMASNRTGSCTRPAHAPPPRVCVCVCLLALVCLLARSLCLFHRPALQLKPASRCQAIRVVLIPSTDQSVSRIRNGGATVFLLLLRSRHSNTSKQRRASKPTRSQHENQTNQPAACRAPGGLNLWSLDAPELQQASESFHISAFASSSEERPALFTHTS